jgi:gliding motility-associated-like protein
MKTLLSIFFSIITCSLYSQTLIMNEVSQGVSGSMEYVEFVVADTTVNYNCGLTVPPSIDIRGWIFDDNSGYHGTGGIAAGAVRFSFDPLWAAVPMGTIILIYNDASADPSIPAIDLSFNDGNCIITAPISNVALFESNNTTPGALACSYPASGWTAGGSWSNTLLANTGDCARIVNLSGCEVFSVCYGNVNLNTAIYFAAGAELPTDHRNTVYYFNGGDPTIQSNWSIGCTDNETVLDANQCGANFQTPGAPNNALNQNYIGQFNNNCSPITPLVAVASVIQNEICGCDGQATVSASGSIPGYTYEWQDGSGAPIGQTGATATGLCAGDYLVEVTSSIGCTDIQTVTISSGGSLNVNAQNDSPICAGEALGLVENGSSAIAWSWTSNGSAIFSNPTAQNPTATNVSDGEIFTVTITSSGGCTSTAQTTAIVNPMPTATISGGGTFCNPAPNSENIVVTISDGTPGYTLTYSLNGNLQTITASTAGDVYFTGNGTYILTTISDVNCTNVISGSASLDITNNVLSPVILSGDTDYCVGDELAPIIAQANGIATWYSDASATNLIGTGDSIVPSASVGTVDYYVQQSINNCLGPLALVSISIEPCDLIIPTAFTPDNDQVNDNWELLNLDEIYPDNVVTIYNRWGSKLYQSEKGSYSMNPWDGKYEDEGMPVASYYFIIEPNKEGKEIITGIVSIVLED